MGHTFFVLVKKPERTSSQRPYGWKWHFVVPNLSLSCRLLQATLPWLVSCCDSSLVTPCRRCFRPSVQISPVLSPASTGACPHRLPCSPSQCYRSQSQPQGHNSRSGAQSQLTLLPVRSGRIFFPVHILGLLAGFLQEQGWWHHSSAAEEPPLLELWVS